MERPIVVQKFGGASVGTVDRIRDVAARVLATQSSGVDVVVVVSAMMGETNRLIELAHETSAVPDRRELDVIAAVGEQISAGLLTLAIQARGGRARSLLGHQIKIVTDGDFGSARIGFVEAARMRASLQAGEIPVVAGFQGVDSNGDITTLGRGGADTTAVAVAAALDAVCEIYTDVDGVFTSDPSVCGDARMVARCSSEAMLALARHGAQVLHPRCIEIARKYGVPVHLRNAFHHRPGTMIVDDDGVLDRVAITGLALDRNITLLSIPLEPRRLLSILAERQISFETVRRGTSSNHFGIAIPDAEVARAQSVLEETGIPLDSVADIAKVTVVGRGLSTPSIMGRFTRAIKSAEVELLALVADDTTLRCLVPKMAATRLLRILHDTFVVDIDVSPNNLRSA